MKKIFVLFLSLLIFLRFCHRIAPVFAQEQLDLTTSITTGAVGRFDIWGLPVETPPPQFNMLGLSGYVAISSSSGSESLYLALISILNSPSGNCPSEPILFASSSERREKYPDSYSISNFIVKNINDGRMEVPTSFTLPVKVPLEGCFFILVNGGNPAERKSITVESHMSLIYDTEIAPSPAPYFARTSFEFCYGINGCRLSTPEAGAQYAFTRVTKIDSPHYLWSLSGNVSASTFVPSWSREPEGPWTMEFDYFLYKDCPPPPIDFSGPIDYYSQIPADAEKLFSLNFQGDGRGIFHQPVFKEFEPKLIEPGNCLVGMTRSIGDAAFSNESQVYTLIQPVQEEICEAYDPGEHPLGWAGECTLEDSAYCVENSCIPYSPPYTCVAANNTPYRITTSGSDQFVYCGTNGGWRDADYRQERCSEVSALEGWFSGCGGEACFIESGEGDDHGDYSSLDINNKDKECCGDDADENYICNNVVCKCCRDEHDYVDRDGKCRIKKDLKEWYGATNGPCENKLYCNFDGRSVYQEDSSLIEVVLQGNCLYRTPFTPDRSASPSWNIIRLETTPPYSSGPCQDGFCALDTVSYRNPSGGIRESFITSSGKKFGRLFPGGTEWNVIDLGQNIEKYAASDGPCYEAEVCLLDTRDFRGAPLSITEQEVITRGGQIFNYWIQDQYWGSEVILDLDKYTELEESPCHGKQECHFDTRTFFESGGMEYEEVTINGQLYQYENLPYPNGTWRQFQLRAIERADLDDDGDIDNDDIKILLSRYNISGSQADLNSDGIVNGIDLGEMRRLIGIVD